VEALTTGRSVLEPRRRKSGVLDVPPRLVAALLGTGAGPDQHQHQDDTLSHSYTLPPVDHSHRFKEKSPSPLDMYCLYVAIRSLSRRAYLRSITAFGC
jgi:hypothetical protein